MLYKSNNSTVEKISKSNVRHNLSLLEVINDRGLRKIPILLL